MTNREKLIKARAYALWEAEGCPHGREEQHWRQATLDVDGAEPDISAANRPAAGEGSISGPDRQSPVMDKPAKRPRAKAASSAAGAKAVPAEPSPKPRGRGKAKA